MGILFDLHIIVYYRYGNGWMFTMFIGEITAPMHSLREILPFIVSDSAVIINN